MIQKLSTRTPSLEDKFKMLKEIASEEDIVLQLEQVALEKPEVFAGSLEKTTGIRYYLVFYAFLANGMFLSAYFRRNCINHHTREIS